MDKLTEVLFHNIERAAKASIKPGNMVLLDANSLGKFNNHCWTVFREIDKRCEERGITQEAFYQNVLEKL